ncbi:alpha/beta hydrolase [Roseisalinus antarcticus]|nr:alpha/beta hydrolase [Roseisalinus antarcticus]
MALLSINSDDTFDSGALRRALASLPEGAPVVVMIHGFKFSPACRTHDPHDHILSLRPGRACWKAVSWPKHLHLHGAAGLAIGFGWNARGSIWRAWRASARAGRRLSRLIALVREAAPDRSVHLVAHSLGARVALGALPGLPAGAVARIVLISAAAFRTEAERRMATAAGRAAEVFSVTGRENAVFDLLLRIAMPLGGATLGRRGPPMARWLDLPLDQAESLEALAALGFPIAPPRVRICHWSGYLRPGVWRLYRVLLLTPEATPLGVLRAQLARPAPRPTPVRALARVHR